MASSKRRERDRANTRERIIEAALHALESDGASALTIRRIAADVDYTAPIVYQHFANKDALVLELVRHGYVLMRAELEEALHEPDTDQKLLRLARDYVRFAGRHQHLYEAMNGPLVGADERRRASEPVYEVLMDMLTAWSQRYSIDLVDRTEACEILWGTLYGMAALAYSDAIRGERAQHLAEKSVAAILLGWRAEAV